MKELERFIEIQSEIIERATIGIWLGRLLVLYLLVAAVWCFREAYIAHKIQKENERKLDEIRNRKADSSCFFYSSNMQKS